MLDTILGKTPSTQALSVIRLTVSILLIIHGVARLYLGIVDDFGGFLTAVGFPLGTAIAWGITIVEIIGGGLLALGQFKLPLSVYFALQLLTGIFLVHGSEGWFVVGAGNNGMEYSVLLIICLLSIAYYAKAEASG